MKEVGGCSRDKLSLSKEFIGYNEGVDGRNEIAERKLSTFSERMYISGYGGECGIVL